MLGTRLVRNMLWEMKFKKFAAGDIFFMKLVAEMTARWRHRETSH